MNWVFVYGTLRPGQKYHHLIERYVAKAEAAYVPGRLYHLEEGYPALVLADHLPQLEKSGMVRGDLLGIAEWDKALPILDELEDYYGPGDPRNLYERQIISVRTADDNTVTSTVYVFSADKERWLNQNAIPVPEGDWVRWKLKKSPFK